MSLVIPINNQLSYRSIPRNKDLGLTINNSCNFPHRMLVVDRIGNCFVCACEAWLPFSVGNITDFEKLEDIWSSPGARQLQQDIDSKKFTHCAVDRCGVINSDQLAKNYCGPTNRESDSFCISINIDDSCNLRCPSCRKDQIMITQGDDFDRKQQMVKHLVTMLEQFDRPAHIVMSGNGDPLASNIMRPLIKNWQPRANHSIRLFTNGLLLEKQLTHSPVVNNITQYFISIDAGSKDVYEKVRLGGLFSQLRKNFEFLRNLVDKTHADVLLKFVLQKDNVNDMINFADLCNEFGFSGVINRLENWGTWPSFDEHDVIGNVNHELHGQAINNLKEIFSQGRSYLQFNSSLADICQ
jgi:MoaA/NifB/PqqE/SkfB family radical SAM enzyme